MRPHVSYLALLSYLAFLFYLPRKLSHAAQHPRRAVVVRSLVFASPHPFFAFILLWPFLAFGETKREMRRCQTDERPLACQRVHVPRPPPKTVRYGCQRYYYYYHMSGLITTQYGTRRTLSNAFRSESALHVSQKSFKSRTQALLATSYYDNLYLDFRVKIQL